MAKGKYYPRICDQIIKKKLSASGALLIEGPKACGKTETGKQFAKSTLFLQNPNKYDEYRSILNTEPSLLLKGDKPRLIDEWQDAPKIFDAVRFDVDQTGNTGGYILTGSASPRKNNRPKHSGTGRFARLKMYPMSLFESKESTGSVSLKQLFENKDYKIEGESLLKFEDIVRVICRGGWPNAVINKNNKNKNVSEQFISDYIDSIINIDISVDNITRNPQRMRQILRSYARNISTMASKQTIFDDIKANDVGISRPTLTSYLNVLNQLFIIDEVEAWSTDLRSKTAVRTSNKLQFVDPSIAAAVLGFNANKIINNSEIKFLGFLFESLVVRDLRIYSQPIGGTVFHYRDKNNLEVDCIIELKDGTWAAAEVKLGGDESIENAAQNLLKLKKKKNTEPSFLMVIVGTGQYAYRRQDGILVVPIGALKD